MDASDDLPQQETGAEEDNRRRVWLKSPAFVSSSQLLELFKDDDAPTKSEEETTPGALPKEDHEPEQDVVKRDVDGEAVDPFDAPLAQDDDPFLPETDPVVGDEDEDDIFLSQTAEETEQEAAVEAAAIREVFGAPDLKTLFESVRSPSPTTGDEEDNEDEDAARAKKRKHDENEDDEKETETEEVKEDETEESATKKRRGDDGESSDQ